MLTMETRTMKTQFHFAGGTLMQVRARQISVIAMAVLVAGLLAPPAMAVPLAPGGSSIVIGSATDPFVGGTQLASISAPFAAFDFAGVLTQDRSEEHTSELQSRLHLVCRLLLEKKKVRMCTDTNVSLFVV